jgi:hypothetical protein
MGSIRLKYKDRDSIKLSSKINNLKCPIHIYRGHSIVALRCVCIIAMLVRFQLSPFHFDSHNTDMI